MTDGALGLALGAVAGCVLGAAFYAGLWLTPEAKSYLYGMLPTVSC